MYDGSWMQFVCCLEDRECALVFGWVRCVGGNACKVSFINAYLIEYLSLILYFCQWQADMVL